MALDDILLQLQTVVDGVTGLDGVYIGRQIIESQEDLFRLARHAKTNTNMDVPIQVWCIYRDRARRVRGMNFSEHVASGMVRKDHFITIEGRVGYNKKPERESEIQDLVDDLLDTLASNLTVKNTVWTIASDPEATIELGRLAEYIVFLVTINLIIKEVDTISYS